MMYYSKVLSKGEINKIAEDVKKLPANKVASRLLMLAAIYGDKQVKKISKAIFAKEA